MTGANYSTTIVSGVWQRMLNIVSRIQVRIVGTQDWLPLNACAISVKNAVAKEVFETECDAGEQVIDGQRWEYRI